MDNNLLDITYMAGIFDGEGSVGLYNKAHLTCTLRMARSEAINVFTFYFGGSISLYNDTRDHHQPIYTLIYGQLSAEGVLKTLSPYLRVKKDEVLLALEYFEHSKTTPRFALSLLLDEYKLKRALIIKGGARNGGHRGKDKQPRKKRGYKIISPFQVGFSEKKIAH